MHLRYRNVNQAFECLVEGFHHNKWGIVKRASRNGNVLMVPEPVTVTYEKPLERVLFNRARDCNPFFHLFESLWMLAGRNDVKPLLEFNPKMADYSDDGKTLHGAYGHRWRKQWDHFVSEVHGAEECDQLAKITANLKADPTSRREVLQIWDWRYDLAERPKDAKDLPCNTHAYFSIRCKPCSVCEATGLRIDVEDNVNEPCPICNGMAAVPGLLDMTVCNRSNDLIWGMLGANVVHLSMLQEYMAAAIGVEVGRYNQFTNNLHVYEANWEPEKWLNSRDGGEEPLVYGHNISGGSPPLVDNVERFDKEVKQFIDDPLMQPSYVKPMRNGYQESFLLNVAQPMVAAFRAHKRRQYWGDGSALRVMSRVWSADWRIAGEAWIKKRMKTWSAKNKENPYLKNELERSDETASKDKG